MKLVLVATMKRAATSREVPSVSSGQGWGLYGPKSAFSPEDRWKLQAFCRLGGEIAGCGRQSRWDCSLVNEDKTKALEHLWRNFFADPSSWWDNRFNKRRSRCPDFVHASTKEALWIDSWFNPSWVEAELAALKQHSRPRVRAMYSATYVREPNCDNPRENCVRLTGVDVSSGCFGNVRRLCGMGRLDDAIYDVGLLQQKGICLSNNVFSCLLQGCLDNGDLGAGRRVHGLIVKAGLESNSFLGSLLIQMFLVCRSLSEANQVFRKLATPNVFAWSGIMLANAKLGKGEQAIKLYNQMQLSAVEPDGHVFAAVLKACASVAVLTQGRVIHSHIVCSGFELDVYVGNALVDMYAKCESLEDAQRVFDKLQVRNVVTWSAMMAGYTQQGHGEEALEVFLQMQEQGIEPDDVTCACILKACSDVGALEQGNLIHTHIVKLGRELDSYVGSALISMYTKCGRLGDSCKVFDEVSAGHSLVVWNAMIAGYAVYGHVQETLRLCQQMQEKEILPDEVTFVNLLKVSHTIAGLDYRQKLHSQVIAHGFESDAIVGSALMDMHSKRGNLEDASTVFDNLLERDVVTWSAMISCYAQHGHGEDSVRLFEQMQQEGIHPNQVTFISILKACSSIIVLHQGKLIHQYIIECGYESDIPVGSSLLDMYVRCGSLEDAEVVFKKLPLLDLVAWNAIIAGYIQLRDYDVALQYFEHMQCEGLKPNDVTFVSVLSACTHMGLVDEGCQHFQLMGMDHGILPTVDHYNCMVELFGRAGHLKKAADVLQAMPFEFNVVGWRSLLNHCRTHENLLLGWQCFERLVSMDGRHSAGYMLMSTLYAQAGMQEDADRIEVLRKHVNAWKKPGQAVVQVDSKLHDFIVQDRMHPQRPIVQAKLNRLRVKMEQEGYMPNLEFLLQLISHGKQEVSCGHC